MPEIPAHPEVWQPLPRWFRRAAVARAGSVLLETAKFDAENCRSLLFVCPLCELIAWAADEVAAVLAAVDAHLEAGRYVAGFASYECGAVLQGVAARQSAAGVPLLRLGVFDASVVFDHTTGTVTGELPGGVADDEQGALPFASASISQAELEIAPEAYERQIRTVQAYLAAGHSYQVNFTDRVAGTFCGTPLALYERVLAQQPVAYAAYVHAGDDAVLSFSPELFYRVAGGRIHVRPMKGTWPRGRNTAEDAEAARALRVDAKNVAEHITIVDLLRNDLGRVCLPGSVRVDALMRVERYRTLHQMTSEIAGTLLPERSATEVFRAMFPSGSITGAPKRRTMEIIRETERTERGVYTGAIGYFGPGGEACFNVAIRTLVVRGDAFTLGVGGGITLDSTAAGEYAECRLKAGFLTAAVPEFSLFETMRAVGGVVPRLDGHLARMADSAAYFGWRFDAEGVRREIAARLCAFGDAAARVRLSLWSDGRWEIERTPLEAVPWGGRVLLWPERVCSTDARLQHKTSDRELYRIALLEAQRRGYDEVLFQNEAGSVTEGAISNVFVALRGRTVTPETGCGVLPGVERAHLLATCSGIATEAIALEELCAADALWLTNALRGCRAVVSLHDVHGELLWQRGDEAVPMPWDREDVTGKDSGRGASS